MWPKNIAIDGLFSVSYQAFDYCTRLETPYRIDEISNKMYQQGFTKDGLCVEFLTDLIEAKVTIHALAKADE